MAVIQTQTPAVTAGTAVITDLEVVSGFGAEGFAVGEARFVSHTAQAAQGATNFATLTLQYVRAGGAPVSLGSLSLGTTAIAADASVPFALGANQEKAQLQAGDVLQLSVTHTGTGGAVPAGDVELETE